MERKYKFIAKVTNIVDGDTFDAIVDLGFRMTTEQRFRLEGIDTPETWRPKTDAELQHGLKAKGMTGALLRDETITIETYKDASVYNRYSAKVTLPDGRDLATVLKDAGMGKLASY